MKCQIEFIHANGSTSVRITGESFKGANVQEFNLIQKLCEYAQKLVHEQAKNPHKIIAANETIVGDTFIINRHAGN